MGCHTVPLHGFMAEAREGRGLSCPRPRNQVLCPRGAKSYSGRGIRRSLVPLKAEPVACSGNGYLTPLRPPRSGENPRGRVNTKTNFYFNKVNSQQCDTKGEGFSRCRGKKAGVLTQRRPSPSPSCPHCQEGDRAVQAAPLGVTPPPSSASSGLQAPWPPPGPIALPYSLPGPTTGKRWPNLALLSSPQ